MTFQGVRAIADAVLFEGYALFPYRASAAKNRLRWQFGVLAPHPEEGRAAVEPWWSETQCLVDTREPQDPGARVVGVLRFLRVRRRRVELPAGTPVESFEVDGRLLIAWDEGEVQEIRFAHRVAEATSEHRFALLGDEEHEEVCDRHGEVAARIVRGRAPMHGRILVECEPAAGDGCARLRIRVENLSPRFNSGSDTSRDDSLFLSLVGAHLLLAVDGSTFLSTIDPPDWARAAAAGCRSTGLFPVLAGEPGRADLMLAAPIILYDHPTVAPESPGDLFDASEIDELLTFCTLQLTDEEKREARATDERVARLLDRVEGLPPERLARLHGAARRLGADRELRPIESRDSIPATNAIDAEEQPGEGPLQPGRRVRLRPDRRRRSDAQDLFLEGMTATVHAVKRDVCDRPMIAVTVEDDPAAELHAWQGRFHYFAPEELELLDPPAAEMGVAP